MSSSFNYDSVQLLTDDERRLWMALVEQSARTDRAYRQLAAMQASWSWRLTAPLRAVRAALASRRGIAPAALQSFEASSASLQLSHLPAWLGGLQAGSDDLDKRWLIDVTELAREDLGAGVERVTRRFLTELILAPPKGWRIQPVRLEAVGAYVCANEFLARFLGFPAGAWGGDVPVNPRNGDCFIGLDFCRSHARALRRALEGMRKAGVPISLVVHDTLPISHPEWFPEGVPAEFEAWLRVLADLADIALCDSQCTAVELRSALATRDLQVSAIDIQVIPLGADFPPAPFVRALPQKECGYTRVLTVGTLEPRKGHAQALAAFEQLWAEDRPFQWVIAGKPGWNVPELIQRLATHPERGRRLYWIDGPDDQVLTALYQESDVLLAPSFGEGYGLPVAEAGRLGLPLVLRDLSVFREIAGDDACYFSGTDPHALARTLLDWRSDYQIRYRGTNRWATWAQCATRLKEICALSAHSA